MMTKLTFLVSFAWSVLLFTSEVKAQATACTVCPDGSSITLPDVEVALPGLGTFPCGVVETSVALFLPDETVPECGLLQSVSTICGCPKSASACELCSVDGGTATVPASRADAPLDFFNEQFLGGPVTCEVVQAYLHSVDTDNSTCAIAQDLIRDYCCEEDYTPPTEPCAICPSDLTAPESPVGVPGFPLETCGQVDSASALLVESSTETCNLVQSIIAPNCGCTSVTDIPPERQCTFCTDGSAVATPDRTIPFLKDQFLGITPTCAHVDASLQSFEIDSDKCKEAQLIGSYCGCPSVENACVFCPVGEITMPEHRHTSTRVRFGQDVTCEQLDAVLLQFNKDSLECFLGQETNWECGCNDGFYGYLGTETAQQKKVLSWLGRTSGMLSIMGALFIMVDFFRGDRTNVYRQLMVQMSSFDFLTALGWILGAIPMTTEDVDGNDVNIDGAKGNDGTCTAQGFFFMLGYGSGFFNIALALYYILVVVRGWKNSQLLKIRLYLYGFPICCALGLAFAGIPYYENAWVACWMIPYPYVDSWRVIGFGVVPILLTAFCATCGQIRVYFKVRAQVRKSLRWTMKSHTADPKERNSVLLSTNAEAAVFWQALCFLCVYYLCWTPPLVALLNVSSQSYGFWAFLAFIAPLQGFLNCMVYVRPRIMKWRREKAKAKEKERKRKALEEAEALSNLNTSVTDALAASEKVVQDSSESHRGTDGEAENPGESGKEWNATDEEKKEKPVEKSAADPLRALRGTPSEQFDCLV